MNPDTSTLSQHHAAGLRWRLLRAGAGPGVLLLHGTGSSLQSWTGCVPGLAAHFDVLAPDLPGHGGSQGWADRRASLPRMAAAVAELLVSLDWQPRMVVAHSAGAAVALQMVLDGRIQPQGVLALNGALQPLPGLAAWLFPPLARLMSRRAWLPPLVARHASQPQALGRLIASTGSRLDGPGVEHYRELLTRNDHVQGALDMMAGWQLGALQDALPRWRWPLWLATGSRDRTVPPEQSRALAARLPRASYHPLTGLGHLAHEEAPERVVALIRAMWASLDQGAPEQASGSPQRPPPALP